MSFRIRGLSPKLFASWFELSDAELAERSAERLVATESRLPCRVSMQHALIGEELLLLNFEHQPARSPYRAAHAIFVRRQCNVAYDAVDQIPEVFDDRLLSVRAFDRTHRMIDADVSAGDALADTFLRLLSAQHTAYLQVHNARWGCYAGRVERA